MKMLLVMAMVLAAAPMAMADGFKCESLDQTLSVRAYNHTDPNEGTRRGAVLVVSDTTSQDGNHTIAKFTDAKSKLESTGTEYVGDVDLRISETSKEGRLIAGTKLMYLDQVVLDVDFSYTDPVADGESVKGELNLVKRDGDTISLPLECTRYLKN